MVLAVVLVGSATVAIAAADDARYRTDDQAAHYLTHRLHRWAGLDLGQVMAKTAYCVGAAEQSGGSGGGRVNRDGVPVFRAFSCVLNVTLTSGKNGTRVFQLDLVKERTGWRATSDGT